MLVRATTALGLALLISACGGGPAGTQPPTGGQATPAPGQALDSEGIVGALAALRTLDSWTFEVKTWTKSLGKTVEQSVTGTERTKPEPAIDAAHTTQGGDFHYIRIGDDLWTNLGTDVFYHYDAADSENLISQYEPLYINGLVEVVSGFTRVDYEPVGPETVNGIASVHYRATESDRENLVQSFTGLTADQWAADAWLAVDGGYIARLAWGPISADLAQASMGFVYDTTSINCNCPIVAPVNVASP